MRGRGPGKTGGVLAGIHPGFFRAENDADGCRSFVAGERSLLDRLLDGLSPRILPIDSIPISMGSRSPARPSRHAP
jgi:hypothetical protein